MALISTVYIESCSFIDMAKFQCNARHTFTSEQKQERENDVWFCKRLLQASIDKKIKVITSTVTVSECVIVDDKQQLPDGDVKRFYSELLTSGVSGVFLAQPLLSILELSRNLRWDHRIPLKPIDSIHVATALHYKCKELLTRDTKILRFKEALSTLKLKILAPSETTELPEEYLQGDFDDDLQK